MNQTFGGILFNELHQTEKLIHSVQKSLHAIQQTIHVANMG